MSSPASAELVRIEKAINDGYHACGCPESAFGLLTGVAVYFLSVQGSFTWATFIGTTLVGLIVGKMLGIWLAYFRLLRQLRQISGLLLTSAGKGASRSD